RAKRREGDALRLFTDERGIIFVAEGAAKRCGALAGRRAGPCTQESLAVCKRDTRSTFRIGIMSAPQKSLAVRKRAS
ncbi:hypothetical protein, partial [Campylobacter rectus]|uniref:hypothetical protein n=1 Tax=Campylobacter rectus TaxID=203 RepID=UPI0028EFD6D5